MILKGDCISVMKAMKPNSVDAVVCDPPYGLEFMGKEWDKFVSTPPPFRKHKKSYYKEQKERRNGSNLKENRFNFINESYKYIEETIEHRHYFQEWWCQWLTEAYRVLKPGGSMLVMGGTRTSHRLACAIEDSGFIIKDTLMWIYGSGFPKAQDLGKMIDKRSKAERKIIGHKGGRYNSPGTDIRKGSYIGGEPGRMMNLGNITEPATDLAKHWDGFKVGGIKPAYEPIIWAVKPPEGSYVENVLKWGVGAVNVDECRIGINNNDHKGKGGGGVHEHWVGKDMENRIYGKIKRTDVDHNNGRFPANIILDEDSAKVLDEQSGNLSSGKPAGIKAGGKLNCYGIFAGGIPVTGIGDSGGASRFFYCAKANRGERNAGLEDLPDKLHGQSGGATQALKEGKSEYIQKDHIGLNKIKIVKNNHPTVKPIKLFEWLIKLVTREGQIILDPFVGSGTTSIASHNTGRKCIGIEKEDEYLEIAKRRIAHWKNQPKQMEIRT